MARTTVSGRLTLTVAGVLAAAVSDVLRRMNAFLPIVIVVSAVTKAALSVVADTITVRWRARRWRTTALRVNAGLVNVGVVGSAGAALTVIVNSLEPVAVP